LRAHRVERLRVLPKLGRADEALVGEREILATGGDRRAVGYNVAQLRAVELDVLRIGDRRAAGVARQPVEVMGADREQAFALDQRGQAIGRGLNTGPRAQRHRVGATRQAVLLDTFVAQPRLGNRFERHRLRSCAVRSRQRRGERGKKITLHVHPFTGVAHATGAGSRASPRLLAIRPARRPPSSLP